ncbi:unnamed protein product [Rotaria magnacalcarata]
MENYLDSKLFPTQFDVIDGDSYGEMDRIELEQDYFTKYFNDIDDNDMPYIELHYDQQQQQRLSQRLSQLSMTNQTDDDDGDNSIPKYLQTELIKITSPINQKDRRHMAYILYEIGRYKYYHNLWSLYLQAGLGQLFSVRQQEPFWLNSETLIRQRLLEFQTKLDHYRKEYNSFKIDTSTQNIIEKLVNEYGLIEIHMESEYTIALLYNKYHDHQLQVQYQKQTSTQYQIDIGKQILETNIQLLTMKHELIYHRLQLLYDQPPRSYDKLEFHLLPIDLYEKLLQQTKTKLMALRLLCLQTNIYQYETKLKLQKNEIIVGKTMNEILFRLIDQRIELMHKQMKLKLDFHTNYNLRSLFFDDGNRKTITIITSWSILCSAMSITIEIIRSTS